MKKKKDTLSNRTESIKTVINSDNYTNTVDLIPQIAIIT